MIVTLLSALAFNGAAHATGDIGFIIAVLVILAAMLRRD